MNGDFRNEILYAAQQYEQEQQVLYYGLPVPSAPSETISDSSRHPTVGASGNRLQQGERIYKYNMREKSTRTGATSALYDVVTGGAWATQLRLKEEADT